MNYFYNRVGLPEKTFVYQIHVYIYFFLYVPSIYAQNLIIDQVVQSVPVKRENMVLAKQEALKKGKRLLVENAINRFLDEKNIKVLQPVLKEHILENPDMLIDSFRLIHEEVSDDRSIFSIKLEGRIFRSRILASLRHLGLSTSLEQLSQQQVTLVFRMNSKLRQKISSKLLLDSLERRLNPYKLKSGDFFYWKGELTSKSLNAWIKNKYKTQNSQQIIMVLSIIQQNNLIDSSTNKEMDKFILEFWNASKPKQVATTVVKTRTKQFDSQILIPKLMDQLMLIWHPLLKGIHFSRKDEKLLNILITGLPNLVEEQNFVKFFLDHPQWKNVKLKIMKSDAIGYSVRYSGKKKKILKEVTRKMSGSSFKLNTILWKDTDTLFIDVSLKKKTAFLNPYLPVTEVEEFFKLDDEFVQTVPEPELMVPLIQYNTDYQLPANSIVYDKISKRGDSTTFRIDSLIELKKLNFRWFRIGETNLRPMITLLNSKLDPIKRIYMRGYKRVFFSYTVPKGNSILYLRVSEENGSIEGITGSFNFFHYLIESI